MTAPLPPPPGTRSSLRRPTSWAARSSASLLVLSAPVATWWLIGPDPGNEVGSDPALRPDDYDYVVRPPQIDPGLERAAGVASVLAVALALVVLVQARRSGRIDRRWLPPITALTVAGVIVGTAARVVTAGVIGANIGAGFMILFGAPAVAALALGAGIRMIMVLKNTTVHAC